MHALLEQISRLAVEIVHHFGYPGIFVMTFLESTFAPIPSEATMIPAGYLVYTGDMHIAGVLAASISGTLGGSLFNYWFAYHYGRRFLLRFGKYFFMREEKLQWIERYFASHGPISIFSGRLIPAVRHFISFPAGLSRMNLRLFSIYTTLGGALWMCTLTGLGYFLGKNEDLLHAYIRHITYALIVFLALLAGFYVWRHRRKSG